jgi:hypothetical protein
MKITKRQLRRIIREVDGSTKKYDDDSALKGDQSKLKDALQKAIIDKTVEDRETREEEDREESNESFKITKRQLRRMIREERTRLLKEIHPRAEQDDAYVAELERQEAIDPNAVYQSETGEALDRGDFYDMISDYSKELTGRRFRDFEKLNKMNIQQVAEFYEDMFSSPEAGTMQTRFDSEDQASRDGALGHEEDLTSMERSPQRQGMGHRPSGPKSQRRVESTSIELRQLIREVIEDDENVDLNATDGLNIPAKLKKLFDPDITPNRFAKLDKELDVSGSPIHQAFALDVFALNYADNDPKEANVLLKKALAMTSKMAKAIKKGKESEKTQTDPKDLSDKEPDF